MLLSKMVLKNEEILTVSWSIIIPDGEASQINSEKGRCISEFLEQSRQREMMSS